MDYSDENIAAFESFQKGDPKAFDLLFQAMRRVIFAHAYKFLNNAAEAEDISVETFIAFWEQRHSLQNRIKTIDHLLGWLFMVSRNRCLNTLKRTSLASAIYEEYKDEENSTSPVHYERIHAEIMERVGKEIDSLPEQMRKVFVMHYCESLPYQEIADKMGLSLGTVYDYGKRAMQKLRGRFFNQWPEAIVLLLTTLFIN